MEIGKAGWEWERSSISRKATLLTADCGKEFAMFPIGINPLTDQVLFDEEASAMQGPTGKSSLMETQAWLNKKQVLCLA